MTDCSARMVCDLECGTYCVAGRSCCLQKGPIGRGDGSQHEMKGSGKHARCLPLFPSLWHPHSQETLQEGLCQPAPLLFQTSTIQSAVICIVHTVMKELVTCCLEEAAMKEHIDRHYAHEQWVWGSLEVREEDLQLEDHWLRGFLQLKCIRKNVSSLWWLTCLLARLFTPHHSRGTLQGRIL